MKASMRPATKKKGKLNFHHKKPNTSHSPVKMPPIMAQTPVRKCMKELKYTYG
jgi:hypothetical protein